MDLKDYPGAKSISPEKIREILEYTISDGLHWLFLICEPDAVKFSQALINRYAPEEDGKMPCEIFVTDTQGDPLAPLTCMAIIKMERWRVTTAELWNLFVEFRMDEAQDRVRESYNKGPLVPIGRDPLCILQALLWFNAFMGREEALRGALARMKLFVDRAKEQAKDDEN